VYVSFRFTCQTQQKQTPNNSLTFHCAYLSLFGPTVSLHVSGHGAIIRRYINKSYTIELCFLYGSIYYYYYYWWGGAESLGICSSP
jgi:hypothetical protein